MKIVSAKDMRELKALHRGDALAALEARRLERFARHKKNLELRGGLRPPREGIRMMMEKALRIFQRYAKA